MRDTSQRTKLKHCATLRKNMTDLSIGIQEGK
jgi:hypothetical protein